MKMNLSCQQWRIIRRIQRRKWPVTDAFIRANLENVIKYLNYATIPRVTIKSGAVRRMRVVRTKERLKLLPFVFIHYYLLRRVVFDKARRARIKKRRRNVAAWSKSVVDFMNRKDGVHIYEEIQQTEPVKKNQRNEQKSAELTQKVKEQLELLKTGKRVKLTDDPINNPSTVDTNLLPSDRPVEAGAALISKTDQPRMKSAAQPRDEPTVERAVESVDENHGVDAVIASSPEVSAGDDSRLPSPKNGDSTLPDEYTDQFVTPEKQVRKTVSKSPPTIDKRSSHESEVTDGNDDPSSSRRSRKDTNANILDLILNKMAAKKQAAGTAEEKTVAQNDLENEHTDGSDEFAGFEDLDPVTGTLDAPLVPQLSSNAAFVSASLDEFMRENALEPGVDQSCSSGSSLGGRVVQRFRQASLDGLVTPYCSPPPFLAPLQPEGLQKQRTVAERRAYLQKNARNHKLAIINNECHIYRELNRKMRLHKGKSVAQEALQAPGSHMNFTRYGWQAASFVTTEFNKYYYQKLQILTRGSKTTVKLAGVRGNNEDQYKPLYRNFVPKQLLPSGCAEDCVDKLVCRDFRACESPAHKSKLNNLPLKNDFKPSPLRFKPLQKPADDDTAAMLLAGGGMVVVEMPTVTLEVFPELTKTLDEVARRYLSYIQPSDSVTRNWASMCASTLFTSYEEAAAAAKKGEQERKNPPEQFVFAVPYQNDRSKLLVRRVIDRSAPLLQDPYFALPTQPSGKELEKYFSFRQTQPATADPDETEISETCKDLLTDLIVSAALSCGENSLSVEDDDVMSDPVVKLPDAVKHSDKAAPTEASKRQSRLVAELRRLNASIIDASANQSEEQMTCTKASCRLGCICHSLATGRPPRDHCGKAKCVLKCECKHANSSKVIRIDADLSGRSLTTEAAFRLRRKVTQRLAPMEKEFTSTVVITGNETLLINESQHDRKRRCTKKPKHYDDFDSQDAGLTTRQSLSPNAKNTSGGALVSIEVNDDHTPTNATPFYETTTELRQPIYLRETDLEKMKHCVITVPRLKDIKNMTPWCMVHDLYKCFCGCHAVDGKPVMIERENNVTAAAKEIKPFYQFEPMETEQSPVPQTTNVTGSPPHVVSNDGEDAQQSDEQIEAKPSYDSASESSEYDPDDNDPEFRSKARYWPKWKRDERPERRGRPSHQKYKNEYYSARPDICRRCVPIPSKIYTRNNNRILSTSWRQELTAKETAYERSVLTEHMLRSVFHYKAEKAKERELVRLAQEEADNGEDRLEAQSSTADEEEEPMGSSKEPVEVPSNTARIFKRPVNAGPFKSPTKTINPLKRPASASPSNTTSLLKRQVVTNDDDAISYGAKLPKIRVLDQNRSQNDVEQNSTNPTQNLEAEPDPDVPRITGCFSLQERSEFNGISFSNFVSFHDGMSADDIRPIIRPSDLPEHTRENFQQFFNSVITNMNSLVSKKMHDIDMALKRDSLFIPDPHEDVLCIMRWTNFLKAYLQGSVHVWDVTQRKHKFLVATMTNVMPLVPGALAISSLRSNVACEADFRMFSAMLLKKYFDPKTDKVAVLMQGCTRYWTIKGYLWPDASLACGKPTPETHPLLTKKINQLCSMLVAQRIREYQQKHKIKTTTPPAVQAQGPSEPPVIQLEELNGNFVPVRHTDSNALSQIKKIRLTPSNKLLPNSNGPPATSLLKPQITQLTKLKPTVPPPPTYKAHARPSPTPIVQQGGKYRPIVPSPLAAQPPQLLGESVGKATGQGIPRHLPFSEPKTAVARNGHNPRILRHELRLNPAQMNVTQSNLTYRKVTMNDVAELYTPEAHTEDHRWMVLNLCRDFSHILVPDFSDLVSLDRILKVLAFANSRQKTVKLQFFSDAQYDAFVTPLSQTKVYFGPLRKGVEPPVIILLQCVDGQMMRREVYQNLHDITLPPDQTTSAFWLEQKNHRLRIDMEEEVTASMPKTRAVRSLPNNADKEECIVIDDSDDEDDVVALPDVSAALSQKAVSMSHVNFTIQSTDESRQLQITSNGRNQLTTTGFMPISLPQPGTIIQMPSAANAPATVLPSLVPIVNKGVITSVTQAPQDASYGSTVYITLPNDTTLKQVEVPATPAAVAPVETEDNDLEYVPPNPATRPRSASVGALAMDTINNSLERVSQLFADQSEPPTTKVTILSDVVVPPESEASSPTVQKLDDPSDSEVLNGPPAKMRRISIRAPASINNNAKDIALEAVRNMMPPTTTGGKDFVEVVDDLLAISEGHNQPKNETPPPPKRKNQARAPPTPPLQTTVFDVDFEDEPRASVVLKPNVNNNLTKLTVKSLLQNSTPLKANLESQVSIEPKSDSNLPGKPNPIKNVAVKPKPDNNLPGKPMLDSNLPSKPMFDSNLPGKPNPIKNLTVKPKPDNNLPGKPMLDSKPMLAGKRILNGAIKQPTLSNPGTDIPTAHSKIYTFKNVTATKTSAKQNVPLSSPSNTANVNKPVPSGPPDATKKYPYNMKTLIVKPTPREAEDPLKLTPSQHDGEVKSGRMVAEALGVPQFEAKYMGEHYLVQTANTRCVRIATMDKVAVYLNRYVRTNYPECADKLPTKWKFYATGRTLRDGPNNAIVFRSRPKPPTAPNSVITNPIVISDRPPASTMNTTTTNVVRPVMTIKGTTITRLAAPPVRKAVGTALPLDPKIISQRQVRIVAPKAISLSSLRPLHTAAVTPNTTTVQPPKLVQVGPPTTPIKQPQKKYFCKNSAGELVELSPTMVASVANKLKTPSRGTGGPPIKIIKSSASVPPFTGPVRVEVLPVTATLQKTPAAPGNNYKP